MTMTIRTGALALATALLGAVVPGISAHAQVAKSGASLPLSLAIEAAQEAVRSCEASGYAVSVAIVDASGVVKLQAKGDHSTIHTKDSSFRKAYSVVTLGPVFKFETSGELAALVAKSPAGPALASLPDILPLAGGVAVKSGDEIIAAIGVGGAPGGDKDEACARAGLEKIKGRIPTGPQAS